MSRRGFTIVELLIVIIVIAVLVTLTVVSYVNISQNAIASSVKSDLSSAAKQIENYKVTSSSDNYPPDLNTVGVKASNGNTFTYYTLSGSKSYCLVSTNGNVIYSISSSQPQTVFGDCTTNGIVGWWKFNGSAADSSGNANDGTVSAATLATGQNGLANSAYYFDGSSYIQSPSGKVYAKFGTTDFSVSYWIKPGTISSTSYVLDIKYAGTNEAGYNLFIYPSYTSAFTVANGSTQTGLTSTATISSGQWGHVVGVRSNWGMQLYVNGILDKSQSGFAVRWNTNSYYPLTFGAYTSGVSSKYVGSIDDVRIYNRALTTSEVNAIYSAGAQ